MKRQILQSLTLSVALVTPLLAQAQSADRLYYDIGGAAPFGASAGLGHGPRMNGMGVSWNVDATCGNFDIGATVSNQLNGLTNGFQNMMGDVVQNATGAVASLPAMIIQRSNPALYDLLTNGVLQGRMDFDKSKLSCQRMSEALADATVGGQMQQSAMAENWQDIASSNPDAVAAQEEAEAEAGNAGRTWVGGQKRGGSGQEPLRVVEDTAKAGYNLLHGRTDTTSNESVSGGGGGWGSVSTSNGDWVGGGGIAGGSGGGAGSGSDCKGGMCTIWGSPEDAAEWTKKIVGDTELRSCDGCEKSESVAGTGLIRELEEEQQSIHENLVDMLNGGEITQDKLNDVSAGSGLAVSRGVIEAMRSDPQGPLLAQRLASEMALARTLTKAMWARRALIAGTSDPGIENNQEGMTALDRKVDAFNRDIELLQSEMEIRKSLASSAAMSALQRAANRAGGSMQNESNSPRSELDGRGAPVEGQ
ncbi:hypothetical protein [Halomonas cupida]|uniref:Integrating conjugative element protein n=1 Tax=Halomonas cupida TaxID=44933 RepID=A0A1M7DI84_9GAMM|nr:hypothetical protein [Halomonas cupida]GEN23107.1 integrating conjugative element protein [Halomonas cupida]SHL79246.1 integrating conjugative element protein, PFL_4711 family [Halomonas cupida]